MRGRQQDKGILFLCCREEKRIISSRTGLLFRRILVPLDFSAKSRQALDVAVRLARDHGTSLLLLHVLEPNPYPTGMEAAILAVPECELIENAKAALPEIAARFIPPDVKFTLLTDRGRPPDVIARVAKEEQIDLIVLTTHGRRGLDRVLLGSPTESVVRHAHCPVYVARSFSESKRQPRRRD